MITRQRHFFPLMVACGLVAAPATADDYFWLPGDAWRALPAAADTTQRDPATWAVQQGGQARLPAKAGHYVVYKHAALWYWFGPIETDKELVNSYSGLSAKLRAIRRVQPDRFADARVVQFHAATDGAIEGLVRDDPDALLLGDTMEQLDALKTIRLIGSQIAAASSSSAALERLSQLDRELDALVLSTSGVPSSDIQNLPPQVVAQRLLGLAMQKPSSQRSDAGVLQSGKDEIARLLGVSTNELDNGLDVSDGQRLLNDLVEQFGSREVAAGLGRAGIPAKAVEARGLGRRELEGLAEVIGEAADRRKGAVALENAAAKGSVDVFYAMEHGLNGAATAVIAEKLVADAETRIKQQLGTPSGHGELRFSAEQARELINRLIPGRVSEARSGDVAFERALRSGATGAEAAQLVTRLAEAEAGSILENAFRNGLQSTMEQAQGVAESAVALRKAIAAKGGVPTAYSGSPSVAEIRANLEQAARSFADTAIRAANGGGQAPSMSGSEVSYVAESAGSAGGREANTGAEDGSAGSRAKDGSGSLPLAGYAPLFETAIRALCQYLGIDPNLVGQVLVLAQAIAPEVVESIANSLEELHGKLVSAELAESLNDVNKIIALLGPVMSTLESSLDQLFAQRFDEMLHRLTEAGVEAITEEGIERLANELGVAPDVLRALQGLPDGFDLSTAQEALLESANDRAVDELEALGLPQDAVRAALNGDRSELPDALMQIAQQRVSEELATRFGIDPGFTSMVAEGNWNGAATQLKAMSQGAVDQLVTLGAIPEDLALTFNERATAEISTRLAALGQLELVRDLAAAADVEDLSDIAVGNSKGDILLEEAARGALVDLGLSDDNARSLLDGDVSQLERRALQSTLFRLGNQDGWTILSQRLGVDPKELQRFAQSPDWDEQLRPLRSVGDSVQQSVEQRAAELRVRAATLERFVRQR